MQPPIRFHGFYLSAGKRLLDLTLVGIALPVLLPVLAFVAVLVRLKLGAPVIFRQTRAGFNEQPFRLFKFRSMTDLRDESGSLASDEERLTRFGEFLRASSLDELPSIWNILRGDLSLVGPRPLLMDYLGRYSEEQAKRHLVKPGLTGLAQVMGRNAISWDEKLAYDADYVSKQSFGVDLRILWQTCLVVLRREGVSAAGHATMPVFEGQQQSRAIESRQAA